jgi:hypothetical protein
MLFNLLLSDHLSIHLKKENNINNTPMIESLLGFRSTFASYNSFKTKEKANQSIFSKSNNQKKTNDGHDDLHLF